jgi:hypothetical protein
MRLFENKWIWIEEILRSIPILKPFKLDLKKIIKVSLFLQILQGNRFVNNSNQVIPFKRMSNTDFLNF